MLEGPAMEEKTEDEEDSSATEHELEVQQSTLILEEVMLVP